MKKFLLALLPIVLTAQILSAAGYDNVIHYFKDDADYASSVPGDTITGSPTNSPTLTSGKIGNAITFVGASSQYVDYTNTGLFPYGTPNYTMNVWVKFNSTAGNQSICMNYNGVAGNLLFYLSGGTMIHSKGGIVDLMYTWTGADTAYHMWTFTGSSTGMATYLDGTVVAANTNSGNIADWGGALPCGAYRSSGVLQAGWYIDGQEDEMVISNQSAPPAQIQQWYKGGTGIQYPFFFRSGPPSQYVSGFMRAVGGLVHIQ